MSPLKLSGREQPLIIGQLKAVQLEVGDLVGTSYIFEHVGSTLPRHSHDEDTNHISICTKGSFEVSGDFETFVMLPGDIWDWPKCGILHQFMALENDSRLFNVIRRYSPKVDQGG